MSVADWIILAFLTFSVAGAAMEGFFHEAFHLAGLVAGYLLAAWQYHRLADWFAPHLKSLWLGEIAAFLIIFFAVLILAGFAGRIARWAMKKRQSLDLAQSRMTVVCRLGMAAEFRDEDTGNHVIRVGCYSRAVAAAMEMPRSFLEMLLLAAPLHDIGKIGIPDSVLLKPGPLGDEEWIIMQRHCEIGESILREQSKAMVPLLDWYAIEPPAMKETLENRDPVLEMAATIALSHHERWDGSGYPRGLAGEAIPLESRIVAVADVFDALTSHRPYRPARPEEEALTIMDSTVGTHFDPRVHAAFIRSLPEIHAIRDRFADGVVIFPQGEGALV